MFPFSISDFAFVVVAGIDPLPRVNVYGRCTGASIETRRGHQVSCPSPLIFPYDFEMGFLTEASRSQGSSCLHPQQNRGCKYMRLPSVFPLGPVDLGSVLRLEQQVLVLAQPRSAFFPILTSPSLFLEIA